MVREHLVAEDYSHRNGYTRDGTDVLSTHAGCRQRTPERTRAAAAIAN